MALTSKQRAQLRGIAAGEDTIVLVGKGGITENTVTEMANALRARELVKGRVLENSMNDLTNTASDEVLYLPDYDAYYNYTSDAGAGIFTAVGGTVEGETVRLTSADGTVLTLQAVPSEVGRYLIVSFRQG